LKKKKVEREREREREKEKEKTMIDRESATKRSRYEHSRTSKRRIGEERKIENTRATRKTPLTTLQER
jgi:hypothetical protein